MEISSNSAASSYEIFYQGERKYVLVACIFYLKIKMPLAQQENDFHSTEANRKCNVNLTVEMILINSE